ncbi:MAG: family 78 glycoside hydrolase catalytic domain [Chloroflexi bacterium]|nr:family 78 glycoside hydrolase catalytic domain [Chloroflexota bacterium]
MDVVRPRLSWTLASEQRGQKQTAYQLVVAASPESLAQNHGDLWDSGKVNSDQTIHVEYAGKPLGTRMLCYWKVRVWDKAGQPSPWSQPAAWSMGLLKASDWDAQWIAYDPSQPAVTPHNGYHSDFAASADAVKWVAVNLGKDRKIDAVRLYPARPYDWADTPGFLFPIRFKIEAAQKTDFSDVKTLVDQTSADVPNPGAEAPIYRFEPISARHVRLTVTRLARRDGANFGFALAEMQVLSGPQSVGKLASVTALDSVELGGWSKAKLVDGRVLAEQGSDDGGSQQPATMVRKEFDVRGPIKRAIVSATGLGLYELRINGQRVGDQLLAPEWTRYTKRIQYQTYDVTGLLRGGRNAVGAQMSGGWWAGPLWVGRNNLGNARRCLLMRLDIELADGATQTVVTDPSWLATTAGPIRRAGIYFGETYDATKEMPGWDQPGFAAGGWPPVLVLPHPDETEKAALVAQCNEPIRVVKELRSVKMTEPKPGVYVFDMGQNMVGWCRLKANAPAGTKITLRHAEVLGDDGTIYTANLRGAAQVNEYTWRGGEAVLEPHFTYHGFRYVELTGLPSRPTEDAIVGRVFHSAVPVAGSFACSNELINKIMHCVEWVQRGNMHGVPTDCPQRDEREGWMGDIQAFSQTAIFNMDMAGFFTKWVPDIRDSQADNGQYPDVAPHPGDPNKNMHGAPAWADAGTIVPWRVYQNYADTRMLDQHFESAKRWVDFIHRNNTGLLWLNDRGDGDHGDWLNGDATAIPDYPRGVSAVPKEVFGTAFFAHSTEIMAKMAKVLGRNDDAAKYGKLFEGIKAAFNKEYVAADGRIQGDTQAGYALALHFNLLDESLRPKATEHLLEAIKKYKDHPSTGIQTTHRMMIELSRNGRHDEAYRLINLRTVPSWGYTVDMGATTIWERWDGYVKGVGRWGGFQNPDMNSFNHWALGSVGEWVWRELAGINPDEERPGYKHFTIRPRPGGDLTWVKARYDSIRGPITSEWKVADGRFQLLVEIPANTTATVYLPAKSAEAVTEGSTPAAKVENVKFVRMEDAAAVFDVGSGRYSFRAEVRP